MARKNRRQRTISSISTKAVPLGKGTEGKRIQGKGKRTEAPGGKEVNWSSRRRGRKTSNRDLREEAAHLSKGGAQKKGSGRGQVWSLA